MLKVETIIADIEFENDIEFNWNSENPAHIEKWMELYSDIEMPALQKALDEHKALEHGCSNDDLKTVFKMLKNRELNPPGSFDKQGRFYLNDSELVDVRSPSTKYPYSQMAAGRTSKFVKAMAEKYKPQNLKELLSVFN